MKNKEKNKKNNGKGYLPEKYCRGAETKKKTHMIKYFAIDF